MSESHAKHWIPLESNPELLTKYSHQLGVPSAFQFHDVFGTDLDLLSMVPQPVLSVLLLFPITDNSEKYRLEEAEKMRAKQEEIPKELFFTKQTISNACGTIGLLHSVLNNRSRISLDESKFFYKYFQDSQNSTPEVRAKLLEKSDELEVAHQESASEAKSDVDHVINDNLHFVAFVESAGRLWELDGRKEFPIDHGPSSSDTLLVDAIAVVKEFMARDPNDVRFNMVALGPAVEE